MSKTNRSVDVKGSDDTDGESDDGGDEEAGVRDAGHQARPGTALPRIDLHLGLGIAHRDRDISLHQSFFVLKNSNLKNDIIRLYEFTFELLSHFFLCIN